MYERKMIALAVLALCTAAHGTEFYEVEPNDTIEQATLVEGLRHGDRIAGRTFLNNDYFRLRATDLAMGRVYMHTLTAAAAGNNNIGRVANEFRGVLLVSIGGSQNPAQAWEENPAFLKHRWYSFGGTTEVNLEMNSRLGSPAYGDYAVEYGQEEVEVADLGSFAPGEITIRQTQGPASGSFILYDESGVALLSGRNEANPSSPFSVSTVLRPGSYTIALGPRTVYDSAGSFGINTIGQNSLFRDGSGEPSSFIRPVEISSLGRSVIYDPLPVMRDSIPYGIAFAKFTVVPEGGTIGGITAGLSAFVMVSRRRRKMSR